MEAIKLIIPYNIEQATDILGLLFFKAFFEKEGEGRRNHGLALPVLAFLLLMQPSRPAMKCTSYQDEVVVIFHWVRGR